MNKLLIIALGLIVFASCNSATNNKAENQNESSSVEAEAAKSTGITSTEGKVIHLTTETFKQQVFNYEANQEWKYEGTVPCIVDFYADWCGPCKKVAPILDELAKEYDGKIVIYKVDTDKQQQLAQAFGIRSIPSILFVPVQGQPQMTQGALPKDSFIKAIEDVLLAPKKDI